MTDHNAPCQTAIRLETEVENIKEKLEDMKGINENLVRLTTLMEMEQVSNDRQNELIEQQSGQLIVLANTVERLNDKIDRTDTKVEETNEKLEALDKAVKEDVSRDKIDLRDIRDKIIWTGVSIVGIALVYGLIGMIVNNL